MKTANWMFIFNVENVIVSKVFIPNLLVIRNFRHINNDSGLDATCDFDDIRSFYTQFYNL